MSTLQITQRVKHTCAGPETNVCIVWLQTCHYWPGNSAYERTPALSICPKNTTVQISISIIFQVLMLLRIWNIHTQLLSEGPSALGFLSVLRLSVPHSASRINFKGHKPFLACVTFGKDSLAVHLFRTSRLHIYCDGSCVHRTGKVQVIREWWCDNYGQSDTN